MCEVDAYFVSDGREDLILESVNVVLPEGENAYRLFSIFGDQKVVAGRFREMNMVTHRMLFAPCPDAPSGG